MYCQFEKEVHFEKETHLETNYEYIMTYFAKVNTFIT